MDKRPEGRLSTSIIALPITTDVDADTSPSGPVSSGRAVKRTSHCVNPSKELNMKANRSISDYQRALKPQGVCVIAGFTTLRLMFEHMILGPRRSKAGGQRVGMMGTVKPNKEDLTFLKELLEAGKVVPVIDRSYPLSETAEAIRYLEAGHARGKVVITVAQSDKSWQSAAPDQSAAHLEGDS